MEPFEISQRFGVGGFIPRVFWIFRFQEFEWKGVECVQLQDSKPEVKRDDPGGPIEFTEWFHASLAGNSGCQFSSTTRCHRKNLNENKVVFPSYSDFKTQWKLKLDIHYISFILVYGLYNYIKPHLIISHHISLHCIFYKLYTVSSQYFIISFLDPKKKRKKTPQHTINKPWWYWLPQFIHDTGAHPKAPPAAFGGILHCSSCFGRSLVCHFFLEFC